MTSSSSSRGGSLREALDLVAPDDKDDDEPGPSSPVLTLVDIETSLRHIASSSGLRLHPGSSSSAAGVPRDIFKAHTRWPGIFFRTLRMERVFLDGQARLHRTMVCVGYVALFLSMLLAFVTTLLQGLLLMEACPEEFGEVCMMRPSLLDEWRAGAANGGTKIRSKPSWPTFVAESFERAFSFAFPIVMALMVAGCVVAVLIHKCDKIREKSWTMVSEWVFYLAICCFGFGWVVHKYPFQWPLVLKGLTMLFLAVFLLISGTKSFVLYTSFCVLCILFACGAYPISYNRSVEIYGEDSVEVGWLMNVLPSALFPLVIFFILSITGSFLREIANRKQFLSRVLMRNRQDEIIKRKTQNTKLQRKLLANMLPPSVVDTLEVHNFATDLSPHQMRALSHRHAGVSIMFAELVGFASFSVQVAPGEVMAFLNDLFQVFDALCDQHKAYKVETVGDQYVAAVGVVTGRMHKQQAGDDEEEALDLRRGVSENRADVHNTERMIGYAKAIIRASGRVVAPPADVAPLLKVGIHTGSCMSGIVGTRNFRFCLFGDTMNTAARMEQRSEPECIHTTRDVIDLVPNESWEKLRRMNVKGKGLMQTYLLRVCDDGNSSGAEDDYDEDEGLGNLMTRISTFKASLPSLDLNLGESWEEGGPTSLGSSLMRSEDLLGSPDGQDDKASSGRCLYQDALPVTKRVYKEHTRCLGQCFKTIQAERVYLDSSARMGKNYVYIGYALFLFVLLLNYLYGYIKMELAISTCSNTKLRIVCLAYFGEAALRDAEDPLWREKVTYMNVVDYAAYRLTPWCSAVVLALVGAGAGAHYLIHRSERLEKWWSFVATNVVCLLIVLIMSLNIMVIDDRPKEITSQWAQGLWFLVITTRTVYHLFMGSPSYVELMLIFLELCVYYPMAIPLAFNDITMVETRGFYAPLQGAYEYIGCSIFLASYGTILGLSAFLREVTNRKQFLQRILMEKQQGEIIIEKTKSEDMQRRFLENILPSSLVKELETGAGGGGQDAMWPHHPNQGRSPLGRLRELTRNHLAVSMLYADVVGFTAFSAQVDPFKVMAFLNELFQVFDGLCDDFNVYKIETVGDCYVAAVGVVTGAKVRRERKRGTEEEANARDLVGFAKRMILGSRGVKKPVVGTPATMRVGVHSGSCISGIIGTRSPKFSLLGEAEKTAAMMEKTGRPDCVHASRRIRMLVPGEAWEAAWEGRGGGGGETFVLEVAGEEEDRGEEGGKGS